MQCTNLGGMEQVAFRVMDVLAFTDRTKFRIATPRPFGPGLDRLRAFDAQARDFAYRGRFGWRDFLAFRTHVWELAEECSHVWITGTSAAALAAVAGLQQPKILSHHYHHFEGRFAWARWRLFYELLCGQLDAITYPTAFTRDEAVRIAPWLSSRAHVVPNGYPLNYRNDADRLAARATARARLGLARDAFVVGNAGWLIARKRFDVFLRTAAALVTRMPNVSFVLCGRGPLEENLKSLAHDLGIADRVRFEGWVIDLADYYRAFDALLFNSDFDTLPCAPMEAASYGCPTVASVLYGGLGEFISHGRNGYLFASHDIEGMASALAALYEDAAHTASLRSALRITLETQFSPEAATRFYRMFFKEDS